MIRCFVLPRKFYQISAKSELNLMYVDLRLAKVYNHTINLKITKYSFSNKINRRLVDYVEFYTNCWCLNLLYSHYKRCRERSNSPSSQIFLKTKFTKKDQSKTMASICFSLWVLANKKESVRIKKMRFKIF